MPPKPPLPRVAGSAPSASALSVHITSPQRTRLDAGLSSPPWTSNLNFAILSPGRIFLTCKGLEALKVLKSLRSPLGAAKGHSGAHPWRIYR